VKELWIMRVHDEFTERADVAVRDGETGTRMSEKSRELIPETR